MRRLAAPRLAWTVLICLAFAAPAMAGPGSKITVVKAQPSASQKEAGLRGAQGAGGAAPSASAIPPALAQSWSQPIPQASGTDAIQCRTSCAQTYYFCNAGGDEDCAGRWAQCAASCSATATQQPYQPAS